MTANDNRQTLEIPISTSHKEGSNLAKIGLLLNVEIVKRYAPSSYSQLMTPFLALLTLEGISMNPFQVQQRENPFVKDH